VLAGPAAIAALPPRPRGGSKYDAGRVGGGGGFARHDGACTLAGRAALRGGAGIVTACVAGSLEPILEVTLTEVMTRACPDRDGALQPAAEAIIREVAERGGPLVLGPGLGRNEGTQALVRALLDLANPLVLDADGLFALGEDLGALAGRSAPTVITPHGGEAGRLLGRDPARPRDAPTRRGGASSPVVAAPSPCSRGRTRSWPRPTGGSRCAPATSPASRRRAPATSCPASSARCWPAAPSRFLAAAAGAAAHLHAARAAVAAVPGRAIIAGDVVEHLRLGSVQP
jgi:NAD(P)H-hydrate epimerase